ncbi:MAG: hypothetical protein M1833_005460 [Piccolia ochrophora]|nr:MAG: hypothetical protein M1833_005460 [Piccolia ochrophora]
MGRHYNADELLHLRQSPLVARPHGLPPSEEWMGSTLDRSTNKPPMTRAKTDDQTSYNDSPNRRPSLFDARNISRGSSTIPGDIILGPPKTAFASATAGRNHSKQTDNADRLITPGVDEESTHGEKYNFRNKFFKDRDKGVQEDERIREFRTAPANGRRGTKEDVDGWTSVRPRKSSGLEDMGRHPRRELERERDQDRMTSKDPRERQPRTYDGREKERNVDEDTTSRRNGVPRGRNELSWYSNNAGGNKERATHGEGPRDREWRGRDRNHDREGQGSGRVEKEPEWMDSPSHDERKQAHTAEEFQRWKERMKASSGTDEGKIRPGDNETGEGVQHHHQQQRMKSDPPLIVDSGMDNFFGLWNGPKSPHETTAEGATVGSKKEASKAGGKASRFTSFFSPQEEPQPVVEPPLPVSNKAHQALPNDSSNEDKEGFQRILQMLGGTSIDSGQPTQQQTGPHPSKHEVNSSHLARQQGFAPTNEGFGPLQSEPHPQNAQSQNIQREEHSGVRSQPEEMPQNRNNEFLFSLMQQPQSKQRATHAHPERPLDSYPPYVTGEQLFHRTQGIHPDFVIPKKEGREPSGPPPGFFDERAALNTQRRPPESVQAPQNLNQQATPRPPGFDQYPPGWPGNPPPQQRHMAPPPGLNADGNRGPTFQPPFMPFPPPQAGRPNLGPAGAPPYWPPPPGLIGMNAPPPPGYPHVPFHEAMGMSGPANPHASRPGASPFDMFLEGGGNVGNGRGGAPGQSRR